MYATILRFGLSIFFKVLLSVPSSSCICPNFLLQYKLIDKSPRRLRSKKCFVFLCFVFHCTFPILNAVAFPEEKEGEAELGAVTPSVNVLYTRSRPKFSPQNLHKRAKHSSAHL